MKAKSVAEGSSVTFSVIHTVGCMDANANLGIAFERFRSLSLILILLPLHLEEEETSKQASKQTNRNHQATPNISITMR